ncbi:MAG: GHKL domain-containing protein [Lachnospiraceae bacterium]|nr:GHKL domain-containing protein [Lachnospiraceae bacterium]
MGEMIFQVCFYFCELLLLWYYMKSFKEDSSVKMTSIYLIEIFGMCLVCGLFTLTGIGLVKIPLLVMVCVIVSLRIKSVVKYKIGMVSSFLVLGMLVQQEISFFYSCFPYIDFVEQDEKGINMDILILLLHGSIIILLCKIYGNKKIRLKTLSNEILIALSLYSAASVIVCTTVWIIACNVNVREIFICSMLVVFLHIMIFFIFLYLIMNISLSVEKMVSQQKEITLLNAREATSVEIREKFEYISKIKHNMKNLIVGLLYAVENGKMEKLAERLEEINVEIDKIDNDFYSCNVILNSILRYEFGRAKYEGINIKSNVFLPEDLYLPNGDMENLFGNLLDNAIEACMKDEIDDRFIALDCKIFHNQLVIKVENSKLNGSFISLETTKENKKEHGFGVPSISEILARYNGRVKFVDHGNKYSVICYLNVG